MAPALTWIGSFVRSAVGALGSSIKFEVTSTVNPLVFRVRLIFGERISGKNLLLVWNLFQMYATRNDSVAAGKSSSNDRELLTEVIIKRRLGPVRNSHPLEK